MATDLTKKMIPVYVDESIFRVFKVYSAETDQTIQDVCKPLSDAFIQSALELATQIQKMRTDALVEKQRKEEEQRLAAEHPLIVSGHIEDLIGDIPSSQAQ